MISKDEMNVNLVQIDHMVIVMRQILDEGGSKTEFMEVLTQVENEVAQLRAAVIRHSRAWGAGMRADGGPDRRFKANRRKGQSATDLRFSKAGN